MACLGVQQRRRSAALLELFPFEYACGGWGVMHGRTRWWQLTDMASAMAAKSGKAAAAATRMEGAELTASTNHTL